MANQTVFKRSELKYILNREQKEKILEAMKPYMEIDKYGRTTVRNLYFDTDTYLLIRRSIEKPKYKEKLRIRSYQKATSDSEVFVELKKKYDGVVYKRRIVLSETEASSWLIDGAKLKNSTQISREIDYFLSFYDRLRPVLFLSYQREAYYSKEQSDFRVTFDDTLLCRENELSLKSDAECVPVLPEDSVIMEIKCSGGIPLWMVKALSENRIYKTSFSKYGTAYKTLIFPKLQNMKGRI